MRVLIIGYGKMGQAIEALAKSHGHEIVDIIDVKNAGDLAQYNGDTVDVAIEFTQPGVAVDNYTTCLRNGIKIVTGTTGWLEREEEIKQLCTETNGTFLFASNFSLGVNLFFKLNALLARMMKDQGYAVSMSETHHIHKKDAPSGTAITLAEGIINQWPGLDSWALDSDESNKLGIKAIREGEVPGTHVITYGSGSDSIEIKHEAFSRDGFVAGAVKVAEWIVDKKGYLSMNDFLSSAANFE